MYSALFYPLYFVKFYVFDIPRGFFLFSLQLNGYLTQLLSLPLLLKTFFKPLKNEYRKDLVLFSVGMGLVVKSFLIIADVIILGLCLVLEISIFAAFYVAPIYFILKFL